MDDDQRYQPDDDLPTYFASPTRASRHEVEEALRLLEGTMLLKNLLASTEPST